MSSVVSSFGPRTTFNVHPRKNLCVQIVHDNILPYTFYQIGKFEMSQKQLFYPKHNPQFIEHNTYVFLNDVKARQKHGFSLDQKSNLKGVAQL